MNAKRFLDRPPSLKAPTKGCGFNPKLAAPLRMCLRDALKREESTGPAIIGLLCRAFPTHIARLVIAVVVNSSKCKTLWAFPNVRNKQQKIMPTFTHLDAAFAIVTVGSVLGVVAARHHEMPCLVGPRSKQTMHVVALGLFRKAATRTSTASTQVLHVGNMELPAAAQACPVTAPTASVWGAVHNLQAPEASPFQF